MVLELLIPAVGASGLYYSYRTYQQILVKEEGSERVRQITQQIREGALAFLRKESQYLSIFTGVVFFLVWVALGFATALSFVFGAVISMTASFIGMRAATISNGRTAFAASENRAKDALLLAFDGGVVMGFAVASLGLIGLGIIVSYFPLDQLESPLVGFGVGATTVALFARVGGGIYTKAADVGADLVGKIEAGIPEDDRRNPGVIADNVGDNVGDVAGMGADIFESYVNSIVGCAVIGATMALPSLAAITNFSGAEIGFVNSYRFWLMITPLFLAVFGLLGSYLGIRFMRNQPDNEPGILLRNATLVATLLFLVVAFVYFLVAPKVAVSMWFAVFIGALSGIVIGLMAEYYTASKPVYEIIQASKTGPATNLISGIAVGFRSVVAPLWVIAFAVLVAHYFAGIYGISLAAVGMLATTCIVMTIDAYGPIADNAGGISEMADLGDETRAITDKLDAAGNTTAAIGKGFAVCSATLTAFSLFGAFSETVSRKLGSELNLSLTNPLLIAGALIGASLVGLVACWTMKAVGTAAGKMVDEIRRQFREIPGLLEGADGAEPDVAKCVSISTEAALSEMMAPGLVSIGVPVLIGLIFGADALAGLLFGTTIVGLLLALFMANTGGAWDNAKKFIEQGLVDGEEKGSDAHKAAVVGDTVGDPFKDTSGPSLNILIKLVSMVALLIAPLL
jgi:K(+)-stimulated pyrophosphate-energized sodium pump